MSTKFIGNYVILEENKKPVGKNTLKEAMNYFMERKKAVKHTGILLMLGKWDDKIKAYRGKDRN